MEEPEEVSFVLFSSPRSTVEFASGALTRGIGSCSSSGEARGPVSVTVRGWVARPAQAVTGRRSAQGGSESSTRDDMTPRSSSLVARPSVSKAESTSRSS